MLKVHFGNTQKYLDLVKRSPETTDPLLRLFPKLEKVGIITLIHQQLKSPSGTHLRSAEWSPVHVPRAGKTETVNRCCRV